MRKCFCYSPGHSLACTPTRLRISLISPAAARSRSGNRNTAARWARFLRELGHRVTVEQIWNRAPAEIMLALHARRSQASIRAYAERYPDQPLVVVLTGTDLYRDIQFDPDAQASLALATRLVVLQSAGLDSVPAEHRDKTTVIYQSAPRVRPQKPLVSCFEVVVSGHLREEKDPFRAAAALAHLPVESRIRVTHIGTALSAEYADAARAWMAQEPRYRWRGEIPHGQALRVLARSRLMVISSRMEGGANVVSEALACAVPVIASRVPGNVGMLGEDYPGYFPLEDDRALARLLSRAENDGTFYEQLRAACAARTPLVQPDHERDALRRLLATAGATTSAGVQ